MDEKAVRGIPWTISTYGATKVVTVLSTVVLARLLVPSDFGLFALAALGTSLLSIFNGNWLGATLIVRSDMDDRARGTVITLLLAAGALMAAALAAVAPLAAEVFGQPRLQGILFLFSGVLLFSGVNWFYEMVMQKEFEFRKRFASQVARTVGFAGTAVTLAALGAGVWSLAIGYVVGHVANGIVLFSLAPYRVRPAFERQRARQIVRDSRGFLGQELAQFFEQNTDYIAISQIMGPTQLGYYSMAYRQAELPYYSIADPVATVTFPAFARMRQQGQDLTHSFLTALRMVALLTCPIGVILSGAAGPFSEAVFGPKWLPMAGPLTVLGIWAVARPLQVTFGRFLNSLGAAWLYGRISTVGLAPFAVATVLAAKFGGISAVAGVLLAYMAIIAVLLMRVVDRRAGIPLASQWRVLRPLLLASAIGWLAARGAADFLEGAGATVAFGAAVVASLAAYAGTLRLGDPDIFRTAMRQGRRAFPRREPAALAR
jgi:O-antigen/teichoic acid export membrane protein